MKTAFYCDERCFWHSGGNYAGMLPVAGFVQPLAGGLPENPETKRRLRNLLEVSGLLAELEQRSAPHAQWDELLKVHTPEYLTHFRELSEAGGGELGLRTPFGHGGFDIARVSAGLARQAICDVAAGLVANAYALSRPPGHHCLPDWPNGFCLLANIAIGVEAALAKGLAERIAVVDWDVHHGNGTEAIFYERSDVLTISTHQEHSYPTDSGNVGDRGAGVGTGFNLNIPLPPGAGHKAFLEAFDRIVLPALRHFCPDLVVVACGFDAAGVDPLSRTLATTETFRALTSRMMSAAADLCAGKLVLVHEGGYSEHYVPFCGHATIEALSGTAIRVPDPLADNLAQRQPKARMDAFISEWIGDIADVLGTSGALAGKGRGTAPLLPA